MPEPRVRDEAGRQPEPARGPAALSDRLPAGWLLPLIAFGAAWGLLLAAWQVANAIAGTSWPWVRYFQFADGSTYNWITVNGYPGRHGIPPTAARAAFFPVMPLLAKTVGDMTNHDYLPAEIIVQVVMGAVSAVAVWALVAHFAGRRIADRAALLYVAFPGAMTLGLYYPEPMGNALAALCLLAVLNRKWLLSGLLALFASAVHPSLIILTPVLAVMAVRAIRREREWAALIAPALAPLGMAWYFALLAGDEHSFWFWFDDQAGGWRQRADWIGHEARVLTWTDPGTRSHPLFNVLVIVTAVVLVAGIVAMVKARVPLPVSLYTVLAALSLVMATAPGPTPRLAWTALGIFPGLAARLPSWAFWAALTACALLLAFLYGWWPHQAVPPVP
ncbi:MAG TPA: hypothetical protein VH478_10465 [Trebonia sp.]|nr:hypothetical protein [Trebonia sp.]